MVRYYRLGAVTTLFVACSVGLRSDTAQQEYPEVRNPTVRSFANHQTFIVGDLDGIRSKASRTDPPCGTTAGHANCGQVCGTLPRGWTVDNIADIRAEKNGPGRDHSRVVSYDVLPEGPITKVCALVKNWASSEGKPVSSVSTRFLFVVTERPKAMAIPSNFDWGHTFGRSWVDFDGDGVLDYCRLLATDTQGNAGKLACTLFTNSNNAHAATITSAGTIDAGAQASRFWLDQNKDGRADFCRFVGGIGRCVLTGSQRRPAFTNTEVTVDPGRCDARNPWPFNTATPDRWCRAGS